MGGRKKIQKRRWHNSVLELVLKTILAELCLAFMIENGSDSVVTVRIVAGMDCPAGTNPVI